MTTQSSKGQVDAPAEKHAESNADASVTEPTTRDEPLWIDIHESDAAAIVAQLLKHACSFGVSDLFFCSEERIVTVRARHLGILQRITWLPLDIGRRCLSHIKTLAGMDIAERRRPLDGRWLFRFDDEQAVDVRINTLPTLYGEDCAMRILDRQNQLLGLDSLGLLQRDQNYLVQLLNNPSGLILVTGPTGSGKTTTLYGCIGYLNDGRRKINTIEDPVEYALLGIRQSQVNAAIDLGFAEILRAVLRQAPDVIMIGEIRDPETAAIAVRAATSGHLVLATLHAPVAAAAVQSMLNFGVSAPQLANCLIGVIAQRLIRTLDPQTKIPYEIGMAAHVFEEVKAWLEPGQGETIFGPVHDRFGQTLGYSGRTGVFEVMRLSSGLRQLISQQQSVQALRHMAVAEGMIEMRQAALLAVARGDTSIEEVFRSIPSDYLVAET